MRFSKPRNSLIFVAIFVGSASILYSEIYSRRDITNSLPNFIIWAWERPEDLTFLSGKNVGVAFYAGGVEIGQYGTSIKGRMSSIEIPSGIPVTPVIRIDNLRDGPIQSNEIKTIEDFVVGICSKKDIFACQIDFEPKESERNLYKIFVSNIRNRLPESLPLTATTLVSWCSKNSWLEDLPIDEVVPMFYRLGEEEDEIRKGFTNETFMKSKACEDSIGISVDEPLPEFKYLQNKRFIYIFNPTSWSEEEFLRITKLLGR